jgi:hypothetical protein
MICRNVGELPEVKMDMKKTIICLICTLAGLILVLPATVAEENLYDNQTIQNAKTIVTLNETHITAQDAIPDATKTHKVLRLGFERIKPLNNLDVYGSRAMYDIDARGHINSSFNVSQRLGNISNTTKNTNYKPYFAVNEYRRIKPTYEAPGNLGARSVYSITGYPVMKTASGIP